MSANDQILIKKHNEKWYAFNVMAESWDDKNKVSISESFAEAESLEDILDFAHKQDDTEYGVVFDTLAKDGASVEIIIN